MKGARSTRPLLVLFLLASGLAFAEEPGSREGLRLASADFLYRQQQFPQALEEFGKMPKQAQQDPVFRQRVGRAFSALYDPRKGGKGVRRPTHKVTTTQKLRVTRRKHDADRESDQTGDNRGLQVNEHLESTVGNPDGWQSRFVFDLDGFKNGHNDVRYRTLLADFFQDSSHVALGDSSSYPSPYFLRGSRLRGLNLFLTGEEHEFQAVAGAYPHWLEERDAYIYPRSVFGLRDRWRLADGRAFLGAGLIQTRDSEKIRTIDVANQPRDNVVFSLDQEFKLIPDVWFLKAAQAYSYTDDNLLQDRFGNTDKLKDTAFQIESVFLQPKFQWISRFERTGPDFFILTEVPSGSVVNSKGITADRQFIQQRIALEPFGPLDLDLDASWLRSNLGHAADEAQTRQSWYTVQLHLDSPLNWPRPSLRGTWVETISSPDSDFRPAQTRSYDLTGELYQRFLENDITSFITYRVEHPQADKSAFGEEGRWTAGIQLARSMGKRVSTSLRYQYEDEDETLLLAGIPVSTRDSNHQVNSNLSLRLWSSASLGLAYTYLREKIVLPDLDRLTDRADGHLSTINFTWPYTRFNFDHHRKLTLLPVVAYHLSDASDDLEKRHLATGRLTLGYEAFQEWKLQLMGEVRYDKEEEDDDERTEASRFWLLWTSYWK